MAKIRHGKSQLPEYYIWKCMRQRCNNPNSHKYAIYGGRGIKVCERWNDFSNFIADMGNRPNKDYSIDRIDNNGNYEPGNCKWSTRSEQMKNRRIYKMINNHSKRNKGMIYSKETKEKMSDTICRNKWGEEKYKKIKSLIIAAESVNKISKEFEVSRTAITKLKKRLEQNEKIVIKLK